jgi:hypothetical protein
MNVATARAQPGGKNEKNDNTQCAEQLREMSQGSRGIRTLDRWRRSAAGTEKNGETNQGEGNRDEYDGTPRELRYKYTTAHRPNENKMSDAYRERALIGGGMV